MSLGAVRASPLGESALSWDHDPMTRPSGGVSVMGLFFLLLGVLVLCAMRSMSVFKAHFHGSALRMMDLVEMSMSFLLTCTNDGFGRGGQQSR